MRRKSVGRFRPRHPLCHCFCLCLSALFLASCSFLQPASVPAGRLSPTFLPTDVESPSVPQPTYERPTASPSPAPTARQKLTPGQRFAVLDIQVNTYDEILEGEEAFERQGVAFRNGQEFHGIPDRPDLFFQLYAFDGPPEFSQRALAISPSLLGNRNGIVILGTWIQFLGKYRHLNYVKAVLLGTFPHTTTFSLGEPGGLGYCLFPREEVQYLYLVDSDQLTIQTVADNGSMELEYAGQGILLRPGEAWSDANVEDVDFWTKEGVTVTFRFNTILTLTNGGLFSEEEMLFFPQLPERIRPCECQGG